MHQTERDPAIACRQIIGDIIALLKDHEDVYAKLPPVENYTVYDIDEIDHLLGSANIASTDDSFVLRVTQDAARHGYEPNTLVDYNRSQMERIGVLPKRLDGRSDWTFGHIVNNPRQRLRNEMVYMAIEALRQRRLYLARDLFVQGATDMLPPREDALRCQAAWAGYAKRRYGAEGGLKKVTRFSAQEAKMLLLQTDPDLSMPTWLQFVFYREYIFDWVDWNRIMSRAWRRKHFRKCVKRLAHLGVVPDTSDLSDKEYPMASLEQLMAGRAILRQHVIETS